MEKETEIDMLTSPPTSPPISPASLPPAPMSNSEHSSNSLASTVASSASCESHSNDVPRQSVVASSIMLTTLQKYGYELTGNEVPSPTGERMSHSENVFLLRERKLGQTAIHLAVRKGHLEVLRALLKLPKAKQFLDTQDLHQNTALHFAASSNKPCALEMSTLLLDKGANPEAENKRGQTPLMIHLITTKTNDPQIINLFASQHINMNKIIDGTTYLHQTIDRELIDLACVLISKGASINVPNSNGTMVSDTISKKLFVRLCIHMVDGQQAPPKDVPRSVCKLCKSSKRIIDTLHDCVHCGRATCRSCSKKNSDVKRESDASKQNSSTSKKNKDQTTGRLCTTCSTALQLRDMHLKNREHFMDKLIGSTY